MQRKFWIMKKILFGLAFVGLFISCKSDTKKAPPKTEETQSLSSTKFGDVAALPQETLKKLFDEATYIDYIFYDLPFSVSQDDQPSIHANLNLISPEKMGPISSSCKALGREFFHIGGDIALEAEIYFQEGCYGYVFYKGNKLMYANKISAAGMKFYGNMVAQGKQMQKQLQSGG